MSRYRDTPCLLSSVFGGRGRSPSTVLTNVGICSNRIQIGCKYEARKARGPINALKSEWHRNKSTKHPTIDILTKR
jgi:hypothetical protein